VILHSETDMVSQWTPRNASVRLLSRPTACSACNQVDCSHGINCLDIRPEEVAIAALEMLAEQSFSQPSYKEIPGYKIESEAQKQFSNH